MATKKTRLGYKLRAFATSAFTKKGLAASNGSAVELILCAMADSSTAPSVERLSQLAGSSSCVRNTRRHLSGSGPLNARLSLLSLAAANAEPRRIAADRRLTASVSTHPSPNHILVVAPINKRVALAQSIPPKQPAPFNTRTKEQGLRRASRWVCPCLAQRPACPHAW